MEMFPTFRGITQEKGDYSAQQFIVNYYNGRLAVFVADITE